MWGEVEVWGEIRSPVLAAPSFKDCIGTSTLIIDGEDDERIQAANDLCERYRPLALKIAGDYRDKGIHVEDLCSAADLGLVLASRRFDPTRGTFGSYAKHWIAGEIKALFKGANPLNGALSLSAEEDDSLQYVADEPTPVITPALGALDETERYIIQSRVSGKTLSEIRHRWEHSGWGGCWRGGGDCTWRARRRDRDWRISR